jgi:1-acyl-sn-glycerol-3-phosphate acyltransferase
MVFRKHIIAAFSLTYITGNLAFWIIPLLVLTGLKFLVTNTKAQDYLYRAMLWLYRRAVGVDHFLLNCILAIDFEISGLPLLNKNNNYLVISNHRSWADILVLQSLLVRGAPIIKFIVKREILMLPLVGWICWAYEYPFVSRHTLKFKKQTGRNNKSDLHSLNQRLANLKNHPSSIINFVEGTRYTTLKNGQEESSLANLLPPKVGGLTYILQTFGTQLDYLLDCTIAYDCEEPIFWNLLGKQSQKVKVEVQQIPISNLLPIITSEKGSISYEQTSEWLNDLWEQKDQKLICLLEALQQPPLAN